jgi:hypothetical protein
MSRVLSRAQLHASLNMARFVFYLLARKQLFFKGAHDHALLRRTALISFARSICCT